MLHIVQENLFKEVHYDLLISTLEKFKIDYILVRVYPFVDWIVNIDDVPETFNNVEDLPQIDPKGDIWCWGSLSMTRIAAERGWKPGTMLNDNHNFEVYSKWWGDMLLNSDSELTTIGAELPWERGNLFLRPVKDSKAFTGAVFGKQKWETTCGMYVDAAGYPEFSKDIVIQVSTPKVIFKEIRLWIVKGKIITGSYYRLGNEFYLNKDIEPAAIEFAYSVIAKGELADAWVLDICEYSEGWKVVEAGCINHAGFYASEIDKTVEAIEDYFGNLRDRYGNAFDAIDIML